MLSSVVEEDMLEAIDEYIAKIIDTLAISSAESYSAGAFHANGLLKSAISFDVLQKDALDYAVKYRKGLVEKGTISVTVPVENEFGEVVSFDKNEVEWLKSKPTSIREQLSDIISKGIAEGKPTGARVGKNGSYPSGSIAEDIKLVLDGYKSQASTIARTETARCYYSGEFDRYSKSGVEYVQFLGGPNACEICEPLVGEIFKLGEGPDIPLHPNCRCDYRPYYPEAGEIINSKEKRKLIQSST